MLQSYHSGKNVGQESAERGPPAPLTLSAADRHGHDSYTVTPMGDADGIVAQKANALVVGHGPGGLEGAAAERHGVPILDEAGFEHLLAAGERD